MKPQDLTDALKEHPFVKELPPAHADKLAALASEVRFARDQVIFREGDQSRVFYLLLSGKVAVEVAAPGRTLRIQTLSAGEELGWSSVLPTGGKMFQARALTAVRAAAIEGAALRKLCDRNSPFGYAVMSRLLRVVAGRLQATRVQLLDMYAPQGVRQ